MLIFIGWILATWFWYVAWKRFMTRLETRKQDKVVREFVAELLGSNIEQGKGKLLHFDTARCKSYRNRPY